MKSLFAVAVAIFIVGTPHEGTAQNLSLKAGAAKVDVTPAETALPRNYEGILDHLYARAIVLDNGTTSAALISLDAGGVSEQIWQNVTRQVESELGIPAKNVLLTATHTHSAPGQQAGVYVPKIVESVRLAKQRLAPARVGYGNGVSYINVNRNIIDPQTKRWWEGPNYDGPSDKTVAVVKFETLTGDPIAVYYNYAMHGVAAGQLDLVSGDAPGTTSRYIEDSFDDKIVALWSSGASGDQNPLYYQQTYDLREIRIKEYASRGVDISNSMPPGGQGLNKKDPAVVKADEPAEADDRFDGTVSGRRSDARDAWHGAHGIEHPDRWTAENGPVPGTSAHRFGTRGLSRNIQGCGARRYPAWPPQAGRYRNRRGQRRGLQPDRPTIETGVALRENHDGDTHEWLGAVRIHSE